MPATLSDLWLGLLAILLLCATAGRIQAEPASHDLQGSPFVRVYPLEELGNVPRGAKLSFDEHGRLAVIHDDVYRVLHDTEWIDLADRRPDRPSMTNIRRAADGELYYGGGSTWGRVETGPDGLMLLRPCEPAERPKWTNRGSFSDIVSNRDGVYFSSIYGVVFMSYDQKIFRYLEAQNVARLFQIEERIFLSCHGRPIQEIEGKLENLREIPETNFGNSATELATSLGSSRALIASRAGKLYVFDGKTALPWAPQDSYRLHGTITALQQLGNNTVAVAVTGKGVAIVGSDGTLVANLTSSEFQRVTSLAANEPGVLWLTNEDSIVRVLYSNPLTIFGQKIGLPVSWPTVNRWNDRLIVTSSERLYRAIDGQAGSTARFETWSLPGQVGVWTTSTADGDLLVGNDLGVYCLYSDQRFERVISIDAAAQLRVLPGNLCFVIGRHEIAAIQKKDGSWREIAPRLLNNGNPPVVHAFPRSVWIEYGANRVGRLSLQDGAIAYREFNSLPWDETQWVNVGLMGDIVVMSGPRGRRLFFHDGEQKFVEAPELDRLLNRSPFWITRMREDSQGVLWGTHRHGVVAFIPEGDRYRLDATTFDLMNDQFPFVQILDGDDIWFSSGRSLYHVHRGQFAAVKRTSGAPKLVSVFDERSGAELWRGRDRGTALMQLSSRSTNLSFRFFSGSYSSRRSPEFEYRLGEDSRWIPLEAGKALRLTALREGTHVLAVRPSRTEPDSGDTVSVQFEISPPWFRTWQAYLGYGFGLMLAIYGIVKWAGRRSRLRNLALEKLVAERTEQLEATMERLNDETRNAATFAERNRLAGEIHDSLQQGLSGLMLQLDSTLKIGGMSPEIRERLTVARNMVSYTRHEVQHAVWDLETPLLKDAELGDALQKLVALISPGVAPIHVTVTGSPITLSSIHKHQLLRIAQEAITNAIRHAHAETITVELKYDTSEVRLKVTDDGRGFDADHVVTNSLGHFGLRGIHERAAKMAARLNLISAPGAGTSLEVIAPLRAAAPAFANASHP